MTRRTPSYAVHDGFRLPASFPVEAFRSALRYRARPGDVFVSTYPKCGTTWVQHIVYLILHAGAPLPADRRMTEVFPHLEEVGAEVVEALPAPRCIKTHLPFGMTPHHPEARYVYVARNPFDCAVSFYHHTRGFVRHYGFADGTFDDYFECFVAGEVDFGDYFDNLLSWVARRGEPNVRFLTYEGMKADAARAVVEIASFLGPPWDATARDADLLSRIVEHSSFDRMRRDQDRWASRRPNGAPAFIRKGEVGDWVNHFSPEQARRLADAFARRTAGTDAASLWPEIVAAARG